jgi:hypothetical protein
MTRGHTARSSSVVPSTVQAEDCPPPQRHSACSLRSLPTSESVLPLMEVSRQYPSVAAFIDFSNLQFLQYSTHSLFYQLLSCRRCCLCTAPSSAESRGSCQFGRGGRQRPARWDHSSQFDSLNLWRRTASREPVGDLASRKRRGRCLTDCLGGCDECPKAVVLRCRCNGGNTELHPRRLEPARDPDGDHRHNCGQGLGEPVLVHDSDRCLCSLVLGRGW